MSNHTDHNPFRENDEPVIPLTQTSLTSQSPHVAFAARSPSIIPTPMYDDASTISSFPVFSPALSSIDTNRIGASTSPLSNPTNNPVERYASASSTTPSPYSTKTEVNENNNNTYGPTFRDDDNSHQYNPNSVPTSSGFHRGNFVPQREDEEEIQLYEHTNQQTTPLVHPPPEQSRVDIFMSKLKGYQNPNKIDNNQAENNTSRGFNKPNNNNNELVRRMPKQRGLLFRQLFGSAKYPIFTWISAIAMVGVFIYELVRNHALSGSWIQTSPFNPMVGPNYMALVNMGSKFVPCMRATTLTVLGNCYATIESTCTIEQVCGFEGFGGQTPNQSFRFFTAIFLHAGVVHILFNIITHVQFGSEIERRLGFIRFAILYFVTGIWGFILGGVLSGETVSSMGCSGALFGLIGYSVSDVLMRWREIRKPGRELTILIATAVISLAIGLLPGIDNFAHIGGFVMGLLLGVVLPSLPELATRSSIILSWIAKVICLVLVIVLYAVFLNIFYTASDLSTICPGCKYLSCLPIKDWCSI